jgi:hypothetical protein
MPKVVTDRITPRWLRPKLTDAQWQQLRAVHTTNLDQLRNGCMDAQVLWDWGGGILTWIGVAAELKLGIPEMAAQAALFERVVAHYAAHAEIKFPTVDDALLALAGVDQMDQLAGVVDQYTAEKCALDAERRMGQRAGDFYAQHPHLDTELEQEGAPA